MKADMKIKQNSRTQKKARVGTRSKKNKVLERKISPK
jgi:hypothetical protein